MNQCKNCGFEVHDLYCSHCGQKSNPERITIFYIWHELLHFITHMERGFFFTSLKMIVEPGQTVKNFIEGKRKNYQAPVSYFLIWTTVYILLLYWIEKLFGVNVVIDYKEYFGTATTTKFAISHLSFVLTMVIPFNALYLYLLVAKGRYNYMECIVAAIYALGTVILFQFAFAIAALLIYAISNTAVDLRISDSLKIFYISWFIISFIKLFPVKAKLSRVLLFIILAFGTFTLWRLYGFPLFINRFM